MFKDMFYLAMEKEDLRKHSAENKVNEVMREWPKLVTLPCLEEEMKIHIFRCSDEIMQ